MKLFRNYFSLCRRPTERIFYFSAWKLA